ncbi:hypothetical protein [Qipengyuania aquimaris]|uniref:hypothetical protein n=1 Tax=Qipengyuania aquimaris TaxID=255984 RepID=UPI001FD3DB74|nr:hypothetical protein [Qipengyuania aquimaris]UOR15093.1 hypothetical protein LCM05_11480 [Qipengyuania aquimaris]
MAKTARSKTTVKWLIDLRGILEAFAPGSNAKSRVIDAISNGEMKVVGSVAKELPAVDPDIWDEFAQIKGPKYAKPNKNDFELAAHLQQTHGAPLIGGMPTYEHFENIAICSRLKCRLVTSGKALSRSQSICKKTKVPQTVIATVSEV